MPIRHPISTAHCEESRIVSEVLEFPDCGSALEASACSFPSLLLGAPHQGPLLPKIQMKNFLLLVSLCFLGSAGGESCLLALGRHGEASLRPLKTEDQHLSYPSDSEVGVAEQVQL